jgi:hypothetical protein
MNESNSTGTSRSLATTWSRWGSVVLVGACTTLLVANLATGTVTDRLGVRIVAPLGFLLLGLGNLIARHDRARLALVLCAALLMITAVVLDMSGS